MIVAIENGAWWDSQDGMIETIELDDEETWVMISDMASGSGERT